MPDDSAVTTEDHLLRQMRDQVIDNDLKLIQARLRSYKEDRGLDFVDPSREEWMHRYLQGANKGPLSSEGLTEIYGHVLELTKRETVRRA